MPFRTNAGDNQPEVVPQTERILQFGTGRFLRAFADCFIDEAVAAGRYDGLIVMVASTPSGRVELLRKQNKRYSLWTRGGTEDKPIDEFRTVKAVSRVLAASEDWDKVLSVARSADLKVILSNTTEIGLSLQEGDELAFPKSYPGRLCALLFARAEFFDYARSHGVVILPCELIDNNGDLLRSLIIEQARRWKLGTRFLDWVQHANLICNSLVDRIVPGLPGKAELDTAYEHLGYTDELLTVCEPYRIWAIQGDETLRSRLGFAEGADEIVIAPDIAPYRTRKIRLLNGAHTLSVPVGLLAGCQTVLDNMNHPGVSNFIESLLRQEIGPVLPVDPDTVNPYIDEVLQRWRNPYMYHRLIDITLQSTTKLRHRAVPTLLDHYARYPDGPTPKRIALGFAACLRFMRGTSQADGIVQGELKGQLYPIYDDYAARFFDWWPTDDKLIPNFVEDVLSSDDLWGVRLSDLPGFADTVKFHLQTILRHGIESALDGTEAQ